MGVVASLADAGLFLQSMLELFLCPRKLFEQRTRTFLTLTEELRDKLVGINPELKDSELLQETTDEMRRMRGVPSYLRYWMLELTVNHG